MKNITIFFMLITYLPMTSQSLEGYVVDSLTNKKLSYTNITLNNRDVGTSTNEDGYFELSFDKIEANDSLIVSFIGYENKIIPIEDVIGKIDLIITLKQINEELDEVIISSKKIEYSNNKIVLRTNKKKASFPSSVPFGYEVAIFIENNKNKSGRVSEINLKLKEREDTGIKSYDCYFRLSFYEVDQNGNPSNYLSSENIIIKPDSSNNISVDLEKYDIKFPKNGIFVGIETINPNKTQPKNSMYITTPNILYTHTDENLFFKRYRGKKWTQQQSKSVFKKRLFKVPYIKLKVEFEK